ncbi:MAG: YicC/YloC family endoribonuclease [Bacteroidota bacterium]
MIKSMTGYGKADYEDQLRRISVEIKSINAKYADVNMRLPRVFSAREITWRNLIVAHLGRGTITMSMSCERKDTALPPTSINQALFKHYYHVLQTLAGEVGASSQALFQLAMQAPEVIAKPTQDMSSEEDYQVLESVIQAALKQCDACRKTEGLLLAHKLKDYLAMIESSLEKIEKLDVDRRKTMREKLQARIAPWLTTPTIDENRLEQELIYYLERLDITEEKVRLAQHLSYFNEVMQNSQMAGKKLGFIAQEIGREINTIGAKANDITIQKEVILMKDALEKIKEQLQNIL